MSVPLVLSRWLVDAAAVQDVLDCLCLFSALSQPQEDGAARSSRFSVVGAGAGAAAAGGAAGSRNDDRFVTCKS